MTSRRRFLLQAGGAGLALTSGLFTSQAPSQNGDQRPGALAQGAIPPETQTAINQGLAYLANRQHPDGSFGTGNYRGNVAIASLGGLAFMAAGHQPGRGEYGDVVTRALSYVLDQEMQFFENRASPGFLYHRSDLRHDGPMYSHGFGTLFLAEAHGMVYTNPLRTRLRETLGRAVQLIINSQNLQGGWRYPPFPSDADISVTICQIMALRAARNIGIHVPGSVAQRCIQYVKDCQDLAPDGTGTGGFRYRAQGGPTGFARTAAGVVALFSAGEYDSLAVQRGLDYLMRYCLPNPNAGAFGANRMLDAYYFYGHYYAAQAMWIAGGNYWHTWFPLIRTDLVQRRNIGDNSWFDGMTCPHYCTAMACIILQVPNNYLPIFMR
jgi:hypothetical protein